MEQTINQELVLKQFAALIEDEPNGIANLSNTSAFLNELLPEINWVGFYLWDENDEELILGPFQGKVACIRIDYGKGVCGTAFEKKETMIVPDVNEFPGHIVCDAASQSEIVVPLVKDGKAIGVLDIDAPIKDRFSTADQELLEGVVDILMNHSTI
jgi:GAF domain-containing protein